MTARHPISEIRRHAGYAPAVCREASLFDSPALDATNPAPGAGVFLGGPSCIR